MQNMLGTRKLTHFKFNILSLQKLIKSSKLS